MKRKPTPRSSFGNYILVDEPEPIDLAMPLDCRERGAIYPAWYTNRSRSVRYHVEHMLIDDYLDFGAIRVERREVSTFVIVRGGVDTHTFYAEPGYKYLHIAAEKARGQLLDYLLTLVGLNPSPVKGQLEYEPEPV